MGYTALVLSIVQWDDKELRVNDPWQNVKLLVDAGADVNAKTIDGKTSLMLAIRYNYVRCVKVFLQSGAHVNIADNFGNNAMNLYDHPLSVLYGNHYELLTLLLAAGETPDATSLKENP